MYHFIFEIQSFFLLLQSSSVSQRTQTYLEQVNVNYNSKLERNVDLEDKRTVEKFVNIWCNGERNQQAVFLLNKQLGFIKKRRDTRKMEMSQTLFSYSDSSAVDSMSSRIG